MIRVPLGIVPPIASVVPVLKQNLLPQAVGGYLYVLLFDLHHNALAAEVFAGAAGRAAAGEGVEDNIARL